jgi:radical SAM protein (TIGR01212 family)
LGVDGVVGLVIGTRPDCVPDNLLDYLAELNRQVCVIVEYGIESVYDKTLERINRGHDYACVIDAVNRTSERGLITGGHVILGLPGESRDDILKCADVLSELPLTTLKLHQLQLIKGTRMAEEYFATPEGFHLFGADEYVDLVIDYVERLRPEIVLERFVSQSPSSLLAIPGWGLKNFEFVEKVRHRMEERNAYQGRLYLGNNK